MKLSEPSKFESTRFAARLIEAMPVDACSMDDWKDAQMYCDKGFLGS
jgi:hypothetical protein